LSLVLYGFLRIPTDEAVGIHALCCPALRVPRDEPLCKGLHTFRNQV
jgi:hypothetical protein